MSIPTKFPLKKAALLAIVLTSPTYAVPNTTFNGYYGGAAIGDLRTDSRFQHASSTYITVITFLLLMQ